MVYPDGSALTRAYLTGAASLPGLPLEEADYKAKAGALVAVALDGVRSVPPPLVDEDTPLTRDVPVALTIQQVGIAEDDECRTVDFTLRLMAFGPDSDQVNALLGLALDALEPGGEQLDGALVPTSAGTWYCHGGMQTGGGADAQDEEPRWPYSQATIVMRFDRSPMP